jgi:hypothetical protein
MASVKGDRLYSKIRAALDSEVRAIGSMLGAAVTEEQGLIVLTTKKRRYAYFLTTKRPWDDSTFWVLMCAVTDRKEFGPLKAFRVISSLMEVATTCEPRGSRYLAHILGSESVCDQVHKAIAEQRPE